MSTGNCIEMERKRYEGYIAERLQYLFVLMTVESGLMILTALFGRSRYIAVIICSVFLIINTVVLLVWIIRPYQIVKAVLRKAMIERTAADNALRSLPGLCREDKDYLLFLCSAYSKTELLKLEIRESELLALQTQINPHFLYNTLDAIRSDALSEGNETVAEIAESLASYFRYSISSLNHTVSLDEELHNIQEYFKIQRYRFGRRLQFQINWSEEWNTDEKLYIPKMILQPLVENAIFHGIEPKEEPGTVTILIDRTERTLYLCVSDDGVGMSDNKTEELNRSVRTFHDEASDGLRRSGHGIALRNVNQRIQLIYGEEYGIYITSEEKMGTRTWMTLPVRTSEEKL